jgi:NADPH:quinone reductase-like Zn-dependent oxidoreductase
MRVKAAVCTRYGPPEVLEIREVPAPVPGDDEMLVRIDATTVTSSDCFTRSAIPTMPLPMRLTMRLLVGLRAPRRRILGLILAGEVERAGRGISRFTAGDRVYAFTKLHFGAYAEYVCLRESMTVAVAPSALSPDEAAAIPYGGLLAMHYLRKGGLERGQEVFIYGASSAVGTSAIQLARHRGAAVTAACGPGNVELVRSLGAARVLDYTSEQAVPDGMRFDLVLDAVGRRKTSPLREAAGSALRAGGRSISVDDGTPELLAQDLRELTTLVEAGHLRPVIDRRYSLDEIVEAHRYVEGGHKRGNVVVTVDHGLAS